MNPIFSAIAVPGERSSTSAVVRRVLWGLGALGSIAALLAHLYGVARMSAMVWGCLVPCAVILAIAGVWSMTSRDTDCSTRVRAGLFGGWWGTLAYNWVRVPVHSWGDNPFAPIRAYGVWLCGVPHSSLVTDIVGVAYQFSNGIAFGLIYALVAMRARWWWAVIWALGIETLAVLSAFGDVFAIRYAPNALFTAFAAHVFYGVPLGWVCHRASIAPSHRSAFRRGATPLVATLAFWIWFAFAWQPIHPDRDPAARHVRLGPDAVRPGWSDGTLGEVVMLDNTMSTTLELRLRHSAAPLDSGAVLMVNARAARPLQLTRTGVYQLLAPGRPWRSVFLSVHDRGSYRSSPP